MIDTQSFLSCNQFGNSAVVDEPDSTKRNEGYILNEVFPCEHLNFYLQLLADNNILYASSVNAMINEIKSVLTAASISVNPSLSNQLLTAIEYLINNITSFVNVINFSNTTDTSSKTTGAIVISGGVGIVKGLTIGGKGNFVRGATIIVASSNSTQNSQNGADLVISTSSDSGAAINTLITSLNSSGGGTIECMEGTFNFTTNLLPLSNVNIQGQGNATIFQRNSASLIQVIYIPNTVSNITLKDFYINGNGTTYPIASGLAYGINFQDTTPIGINLII